MLEENSKTRIPTPRQPAWSIEWFGSQGDFISGKTLNPVSLERFAGLESLYGVGPLEHGCGEVSIFDSVTLISQVDQAQVKVTIDQQYRAGFLVYAIVEKWRRATIRAPIQDESGLEKQLLPLAVESGIDIDQPFPYLIHCHVSRAQFHVLCISSSAGYSPELHEKAKVRFMLAEEAVEIIGFYSRRHRGVFTPRDSDFHMHLRTLDNCVSGHLEAFACPQGMTIYLPTHE